MKLKVLFSLLFVLMMSSTNAQNNTQQDLPKIQFYTLEAGCKMEIYKSRSGESPIEIKRTERVNVYTTIEEGVYDVTIKCTAPVMLLVQVKVGEVNKPMLDKNKSKLWNTSLVAMPGQSVIYTPCWFKEE